MCKGAFGARGGAKPPVSVAHPPVSFVGKVIKNRPEHIVAKLDKEHEDHIKAEIEKKRKNTKNG
jgi:hypothetical protein